MYNNPKNSSTTKVSEKPSDLSAHLLFFKKIKAQISLLLQKQHCKKGLE